MKTLLPKPHTAARQGPGVGENGEVIANEYRFLVGGMMEMFWNQTEVRVAQHGQYS